MENILMPLYSWSPIGSWIILAVIIFITLFLIGYFNIHKKKYDGFDIILTPYNIVFSPKGSEDKITVDRNSQSVKVNKSGKGLLLCHQKGTLFLPSLSDRSFLKYLLDMSPAESRISAEFEVSTDSNDDSDYRVQEMGNHNNLDNRHSDDWMKSNAVL